MLRVKSKVWLEKNGQMVFGNGRNELLEAIGQSSSIRAAATRVGMPYRRARSYIKLMEIRLGVRLVHRTIGGKGGGHAELTKQARELIQKFKALERGINAMIDRRFRKIFSRHSKFNHEVTKTRREYMEHYEPSSNLGSFVS